MKQSAPYAVIGLGVIVMALIAWWFGFRDVEEEPPFAPEAPVIELSEDLSIYANGEHGFLLTYPSGAEVEESFEGAWLNDTWSEGARTDEVGTLVVSITTYRTQSEDSYPRRFVASVRVGKSEDPKEIDQCLSVREESGETALPDRVIGDRTFKAFSFGNAGMQWYVNGVSYRAVHEGACYAVEQIKGGSSYREEPSPKDIPEATLDAAYESLDSIVESFRFAR